MCTELSTFTSKTNFLLNLFDSHGVYQNMTTTLFQNGDSQAVRLPKDFRLPGKEVSIRRLGTWILIEPIRETAWPEGYFDSILIEDEAFARPDQKTTPSSPDFGA
jgi:virulence-associated protein VagC